MCIMYICCKQHTPHDALVGGRAQNTHFPSGAAICCAVCATIIVSKMDGNLPHSDHLQPSDTTVKAPEFDLFLALLIVTETERLVQVPSHLTATEAELLVQFPSLPTARSRNSGLVSFPTLRQQTNYWSTFVPA